MQRFILLIIPHFHTYGPVIYWQPYAEIFYEVHIIIRYNNIKTLSNKVYEIHPPFDIILKDKISRIWIVNEK